MSTGSAADVEVRFAADMEGVKDELRTLREDINSWAEGVKTVGIAAFAAWAASAAFGAIKQVLTDISAHIREWINSAAEAELVDKKLAIAVRNAGDSFRYTAAQVSQMASDLEGASIFSDEDIKSAQTMLIQMGLVGRQFRETTEAAVAMGSIMGDVNSAASLLGRTMVQIQAGSARGARALLTQGFLSPEAYRDIQALVKAGDTVQAQFVLLEEVKNKTAGAASEIASTYSGMLKQLENIFDNIKEELGRGFLEFIKSIVPAIRDLAVHVQDLAKAFGDWLTTLAQSGGAKGGIDTINEAVRTLFGYVQAFVETLPKIFDSIRHEFQFIADQIDYLSKRMSDPFELRESTKKAGISAQLSNISADISAQVMDSALKGIPKRAGEIAEEIAGKFERKAQEAKKRAAELTEEDLEQERYAERLQPVKDFVQKFADTVGDGLIYLQKIGGEAKAAAAAERQRDARIEELRRRALAAGLTPEDLGPKLRKEEPFKTEFLSAEAIFQRMSSVKIGGDTQEKQLTVQQDILKEAVQSAERERQRDITLKNIETNTKADKPAKAGP